MNDRFRFRVWNTRTKKLREVAQITLDARQHGRTSEIGNMETCHLVYQPHLVLEQCTGLKDKNGRLIYEGDIVQHDTAAGPKCWPVLFKDGCFVLPYESGNAWLGKVIQNCPYSSGVVVVGNIHDNADLLEGGNEQTKI